MFSLIFLTLACIAIYIYCAVAIWRNTRGQAGPWIKPVNTQILAILGMILHGIVLYRFIFSGSVPVMTLGVGFSMAGWISMVLYLGISTIRKTANLGMIVLPIGAISAFAGIQSADQVYLVDQISTGMAWHIAFAIPTFGVLCVAFAQACMLIIQDRQLHKPGSVELLPELPAIQTMESNLYWLTLVGFTLMTANLLIGMASNWRNSGQLLEFNHHVLLSIVAWVGFAGLLLGRKLAGWRGQSAARWTVITFLILVLAYFGTRFVNDLVLAN